MLLDGQSDYVTMFEVLLMVISKSLNNRLTSHTIKCQDLTSQREFNSNFYILLMNQE